MCVDPYPIEQAETSETLTAKLYHASPPSVVAIAVASVIWNIASRLLDVADSEVTVVVSGSHPLLIEIYYSSKSVSPEKARAHDLFPLLSYASASDPLSSPSFSDVCHIARQTLRTTVPSRKIYGNRRDYRRYTRELSSDKGYHHGATCITFTGTREQHHRNNLFAWQPWAQNWLCACVKSCLLHWLKLL